MPGKSKNQVVAARIAEGVKAGTATAKPGSASAQMAKSMSLPSVKEFASTPTKGLPKRVKKKAVGPGPAKTVKPPIAPGMRLPPSVAPPMPPGPAAAPAMGRGMPPRPGMPVATPVAPPGPAMVPPMGPRPAFPTRPAMPTRPAPMAAMPPVPQVKRPPIFGVGAGKRR